MILYVRMKLRVANKEDFFDQFDKKRIGTLYFVTGVNGVCKQPYYFNEDTCKITFTELYVNNQILVPERLFEEVEIVEEKEEITTN